MPMCFYFSHDRAKKKSSLKSMTSSRSGSSGGGGAICGVLLDSVIHAGHIAAIHADRTDCGQCREDKRGVERSAIEKVVQTGYKVAISFRGKLLYMQIYLTTDKKCLQH